MTPKTTSYILFFTLFMLLLPQSAKSIPTKWDRIDQSIEELLNSGWQVIAHSSYRAVFASPGNSINEISFSYVLSKGGKYVTCTIVNPKPPIADTSGCRRMN
jgi:hypothetical protein